MSIKNIRLEVMKTIEPELKGLMEKYLKPVEEYWQPSDFLPNTSKDNFTEELEELQDLAQQMSYDMFVVLIGDTITEEALPTYESWLMNLEGVDQEEPSAWTEWVRAWTAEENRHGDLLNTFLYLSGRVNMREFEISTHYLIQSGFDIGTSNDPYKNFVYTSFQEMATNISHRRVASYAKSTSNSKLAKMCGVIAADEARHANAYKDFVRMFFQYDPSEMMQAFAYMMKRKIVMPAHFLRESGENQNHIFEHFSDVAQRAGVYTTQDYIDILKSLLEDWKIALVTDLNEAGEKARDYLMNLPLRLEKIAERVSIPDVEYKFKWVDS